MSDTDGIIEKNPWAQAAGRARWLGIGPEERREMMRELALKRWRKPLDKDASRSHTVSDHGLRDGSGDFPQARDGVVTHSESIPREKWEWFGNAGHLIVSQDCRFHLTTLVGPWLVSTVGQRWPCRASREIHAEIDDPQWYEKNRALKGDYFDNAYMKRFGYHEVGYQRLFETMIFKAGKRCQAKDCGCGLPDISGSEVDMEGYKTAGEAAIGHYRMCEKWAAKKTAETEVA